MILIAVQSYKSRLSYADDPRLILSKMLSQQLVTVLTKERKSIYYKLR